MKKRDGFTIPLVVVLLVIILLGAGIAYVIMGTDLFQSPKKMFLKYISENSKILEELKQDPQLEVYERKLKSTPYTYEGTLTLSDKFINEEISTEDMQKLKNMSVKIVGSTDVNNSYDHKNIKVNYSDTTDMSYEYVHLNDFYGIKIGDVVNRFIAVENNNLQDFAKRMGVTDSSIISYIPNKIELSRYDYSKIFTEEELQTIESSYKEIILNNLTDDMFSKSNNVGDKIYTLKITYAQARKIFSEILTKLKTDETIISKAKKIMINDIGISEDEASLYVSKAQEYIQKTIDDMTSSNLEGEFVFNVHVNGKKLVKTEFVYNNNRKISLIKTELGFSIESVNDKDKKTLINFEKSSSADIIKFLISISYDTNQKIELEINTSGLSTLNKVEETFDFNANIDDLKIGYHYQGTNEFLNSIDQIITTQDIISINTAPNLEAISNLLSQIVTRYGEVTNVKIAEAGLAGLPNDPTSYFVPGAVPYEFMNIMTKTKYGQYLLPLGFITGAGILNENTEEDNSIINQGTETNIDNTSETPEEFNLTFMVYEGEEKTDSDVKLLINAIITSNNLENEKEIVENQHLVTLTYSDSLGNTKAYIGEDEMSQIKPSEEHKYTVKTGKDDNGYINSIVVVEF